MASPGPMQRLNSPLVCLTVTASSPWLVFSAAAFFTWAISDAETVSSTVTTTLLVAGSVYHDEPTGADSATADLTDATSALLNSASAAAAGTATAAEAASPHPRQARRSCGDGRWCVGTSYVSSWGKGPRVAASAPVTAGFAAYRGQVTEFRVLSLFPHHIRFPKNLHCKDSLIEFLQCSNAQIRRVFGTWSADEDWVSIAKLQAPGPWSAYGGYPCSSRCTSRAARRSSRSGARASARAA